MAISALLRAVTRRSQLSACISSYESVSRNVNTSMFPCLGSVLGKTLCLGNRAFCSKPNHNDLAAQNDTKRLYVSNPTKIVFKYECAIDEFREDCKSFKIRKIVEIPTGDALFELSKGGDKYYSLKIFFTSLLLHYLEAASLEAAESFSGGKLSGVSVVIPSLFRRKLESLLGKAETVVGFNVGGVIADKQTVGSITNEIKSDSEYIAMHEISKFISSRIWKIVKDRMVFNSGTGCIELTLDLDDFLEIRIWEIITNGDKTVLDVIVGELKKNGFDFTDDPLALQKLEQAVDRAITQRSNTVKLNLPVPDGHLEMSTTISWGRSDDFYAPSSDGSYTNWKPLVKVKRHQA
ncbi:hypothetical protein MKW94_000058 [Papaver nudicaule]|uniref:Uncharacterized protein n=1 Tax=Papaver nudicaule TaxID=74823 RepID=A0AA41VUT8_PAPNU|nr:hypothetical protein [Papaver nudicaule]MCL7052074.1 hypothetical protein [Papaver nudicaule]